MKKSPDEFKWDAYFKKILGEAPYPPEREGETPSHTYPQLVASLLGSW
jgi:hypothetical protein